jgi:23S rRNA (guanosine2251-2'-O)-methyltransferase
MRRHPRKKEKDCKSRRLYGWHSVHEHLRARPQHVFELYLLPSLKGSKIEETARQAQVPIRYQTIEFFEDFTKGGVHQGVAARLLPFPYSSLVDILERRGNILLVLDGLADPRNLGALLRTAEGAGVTGVVLTESRSVPLSAVAEKTATGATAYLPICRVENLARALSTIRERGYWIIGLVQDAPQSLYEIQLSQNIALVLGGEEKGLRQLTRQMCDCLISIPMRGHVDSLNVSVAGAVALYEFLRRTLLQKGQEMSSSS